MASYTSKNNNRKIAIVILLHFEIIAICHVSASRHIYSDYVFTPTDISHVVSDSCFVAVNVGNPVDNHSTQPDLAVNLKKQLSDAYAHEQDVIVGFIDLQHGYLWESGKALKLSKRQSDVDLTSVNVLVFQRRPGDRTCLTTGNMQKQEPVADLYSGNININFIVEFVNTMCNTYRKPNGQLTVEGLHRQEILNTLFHVEHETSIDINTVLSHFHTGEQHFCSRESCNQSDRDTKVNSNQNSEKRKASIPFKHFETGINKCERISMPTKGEFLHNYLKISKPVIIENAIHSWPALQKWTNEYFRTNYGEKKVHIKLTPAGEFEGVDSASNFENFKSFRIPEDVKRQLSFPDLVVVRPATENMKFSEFIDIMNSVSNGTKKGYSAYLEYSSVADILPDLEEDISEMPIADNLLNLEHVNIWLSDGNTLGKLHFDPFDNFLCQMSGRKQLILFGPHDNSKLYEAHIPEAMLSYDEETKQFRKRALVDSTSMVMSPVDIISPDLERFPLFGMTHPLNCTINEGDVLFMPAFWWHEVQSYPSVEERRNLAVNFWYEPFLTKEFPCQECKLDVNPKYRHLL